MPSCRRLSLCADAPSQRLPVTSRPRVLIAVVSVAVVGCGGSRPASTPAGNARADVEHALTSLAGYRGPSGGPHAQSRRLVVFVASDLTNGGVAGVARGVQQAARAIGWPLEILDGGA